MQINLETSDNNSVQSYSDTQIQINSIIYDKSLIVSRKEIISDLAIKSIHDMDRTYLEALLQCKPEVILIGHKLLGMFAPMEYMQDLSKLGVGMECMSIGAAARTFNVLLSEGREVVVGFIL